MRSDNGSNLIWLLVALVFAMAAFVAMAADEVHVRASIRYEPDDIFLETSVKKFDQTGSLSSMGRQLIETGVWENVVINGFTNGYAFFRNDSTNTSGYIELATAGATNIFAKLEATEFCLLPLSTGGILARCTGLAGGQILKKFNVER